MIKLIWLARTLVLICTCILLLFCSNTGNSIANQDSWQSLFNGSDLSGWRQLGGTAKYEVVDGAIVGTSKLDTPNSFLTSEKHFKNFILEFEFNVDDGLNSGLQFRSNSKPDFKNGRVHGYQFEFDTSARSYTAGIYDEARRAWLYTGDYNAATLANFKHQQWNRGRIECYGNEVRTYLNGDLVARVIDLPEIDQKGFIGLQVHSIRNKDTVGKQVRWKNIRIKEISQPLAPLTDKSHFIRNLVPDYLSDMESSSGWQLLFHENTSNTILGNKEYSSFELQFEFKHQQGSDSGLQYFLASYLDQKLGEELVSGLEYQISDNNSQGLSKSHTMASVFDILPVEEKVHGRRIKAATGKWNFARIIAKKDGHVEHWLNGFRVLEYNRFSKVFSTQISQSKYKNLKDFGQVESGKIQIQNGSGDVSFRSIKIREL